MTTPANEIKAEMPLTSIEHTDGYFTRFKRTIKENPIIGTIGAGIGLAAIYAVAMYGYDKQTQAQTDKRRTDMDMKQREAWLKHEEEWHKRSQQGEGLRLVEED